MKTSILEFCRQLISSPDLVLAVRGQKIGGRGEGKGEEETRSGKIRIETSADWLFHNARESSTRVFISFARSAKNMPKTFYRAKKKLSRLCLTSTEHDKMYLMFSDTERAVKLGSLIKTGKNTCQWRR